MRCSVTPSILHVYYSCLTAVLLFIYYSFGLHIHSLRKREIGLVLQSDVCLSQQITDTVLLFQDRLGFPSFFLVGGLYLSVILVQQSFIRPHEMAKPTLQSIHFSRIHSYSVPYLFIPYTLQSGYSRTAP